MRAIAGYLPLYLRKIGWTAIHADSALTVFILASILGAIPLAVLSDRLGRRKVVLFAAMSIAIICAGLLPIVSNAFVWVIVVILGFFYAAYVALAITMCLETSGVGAKYGGVAVGLLYTLQRLGGFIAPPLGDSLASFNLGMPFIFWASLFVSGVVILIFVKETGWKAREA
jgi:MFS family permease